MTWILRLVWFVIGQRYKFRLLRKLKKEGVIAYLCVLQGSRRLLILAIVAFFALQIILLAGLGALVTAFMLWDYDLQSKLEILLGVFLAIFLLPLTLLCVALSERVWFRASGAQKLVEKLQSPRV